MKSVINLSFLAAILFLGSCNPPGNENPILSSAVTTDSIVVENLISQSEKSFTSNENPNELFDKSLRDAEKIALKNDYHTSLVRIYLILGKRYRNRSEYLQAMNFHKKALELALMRNIHHLVPECYNQLGVVYRRIDENSLALDMHLKGLKSAEESKDTFNIGVSLNGIGNINLSLNRYQAAIEYFKKSMDMAVLQNNVLGQAINTNNIGEAHRLMGNVDTALVYFFKSLEYNTAINSKIGQSICFNSLGDTYVAKNEPKKALGYLLKALKITQEVGDLMHVATSLNRVGETYLDLGDYTNAQSHLLEGLELSRKIGSKYLAEDAAHNLAKLYEKQQDFDKALTYFKIKSDLKDSLMNEKNIYHITTLEAIFESEKQKDKIEELNRNNEIQKSKIAGQKVLIVSITIGTVLISLLLFLITRQNTLKEKYRQLKHKQRLLRSQMNPHFIFNALSAIQVFILENDMERSSRFLSDFAKLMRQVLRNSNYEYISLQEEIYTLQYYIDLQKLRFPNPFEMQIFVDNTIDTINVAIPPMLTQPFIENSIEHGLKPIGGQGKIELRFLHTDRQLVVEVDDNGIGLTQHKEQRLNGRNHESMALKIVRERLDIIKKDTGKPVSFEMIDKKQFDPFSSGTLVRLSFPIIDKNTTKIESDERL
ncbi:MAG: tetratricopeptide repeat protein [Breznakibacter sp.]